MWNDHQYKSWSVEYKLIWSEEWNKRLNPCVQKKWSITKSFLVSAMQPAQYIEMNQS